MISRRFKVAVKLSDIPAWKIAYKAGINPNVLSKIMSGALRVKSGDVRVINVGKVIGLDAEECFEANGKGGSGYGN